MSKKKKKKLLCVICNDNEILKKKKKKRLALDFNLLFFKSLFGTCSNHSKIIISIHLIINLKSTNINCSSLLIKYESLFKIICYVF